MLARLAEHGLTFALDDFGTGYSSLGQLKRLPLAEVKIDKSFVLDMTDNPDSAAIVRSTIQLAHTRGLHIVAEGVETQQHWDALVALGCHTAQGYLLSRPLPASRLTIWLHQWPAPWYGVDGARGADAIGVEPGGRGGDLRPARFRAWPLDQSQEALLSDKRKYRKSTPQHAPPPDRRTPGWLVGGDHAMAC